MSSGSCFILSYSAKQNIINKVSLIPVLIFNASDSEMTYQPIIKTKPYKETNWKMIKRTKGISLFSGQRLIYTGSNTISHFTIISSHPTLLNWLYIIIVNSSIISVRSSFIYSGLVWQGFNYCRLLFVLNPPEFWKKQINRNINCML